MKMSQAFAQLGHELRLLIPCETPDITPEELWQHYGLKTNFQTEWMRATPRWRKYVFTINALLQTKIWGADILFTRNPLIAALASLLGIPTIFEIHDFPTGRSFPLLIRFFLKGKGARAFVSITKKLSNTLEEHFKTPQRLICIAPDGVDLNRFQSLPSPKAARTQLNLPEGFTVGYTGHFYVGRGIALIVSIAKEMPDVNFLLVGGEPTDVRKVQTQINELGLKNINLAGFVSNTKLPLYQAASNILLMPYKNKVAGSGGGDISRYLSPMKMFEYLASGRPIISSDLPVLQEVLNNQNSVILPANDPSSWVEEIRQLQADPARREALAKNARLTAEKHSWISRAERVLTNIK
jgi:glycosyltransferase involved in cell wall biosynthesis